MYDIQEELFQYCLFSSLTLFVIATRYKIVKDNAKLSGRDAGKQWQYFAAMHDVFAGDPTVLSISVESTTSLGMLQFIYIFITS